MQHALHKGCGCKCRNKKHTSHVR